MESILFSIMTSKYSGLILILIVWGIICLLRAKFDKKFVFSSKIFYILLISGIILFSIISGMYIGYVKNYGSSYFWSKLYVENSIIVAVFNVFIYALLLAIIFNLNSIKKNIIKLLIVILLFPVIMQLMSVGLVFSVLGNVSNILILSVLLIITAVFIFLRLKVYKDKNVYQKLAMEIATCILLILTVIFAVDLCMQKLFVFSDDEIEQFESELKKDFDIAFGDSNWEIESYRKTIMQDLEAVEISYKGSNGVGSEAILFNRDERDVLVANILLNMANEEIFTSLIKVKYDEYPTIEEINNSNVSVANFVLEKFVELEDVYVEYRADEYTVDEVKEIVGENAKLVLMEEWY